MNNLVFILPFFGSEPYWFKYFLISVGRNKKYQWLLFTDFVIKTVPDNVKHNKMSLLEFNQFVSLKLGVKTNIIDPYKICDFKPAFGHIFQDYINEFAFWAYCDADIILGDISKFLDKLLKKNFDVISPDKDFFPGHFCIFKNTDRINNLYQQTNNYKAIFESSKNFYFDEFLIKKGLENHQQRRFSIQKVLWKKKLIRRIKRLFPGLKIFRRMISKNTELYDFNRVIKFFSDQGKIVVFQEQFYESDFTFKVQGLRRWDIQYIDGNVYYGNKELLYFHFQLSKKLKNFVIVEKDKNRFSLVKK